MDVFDFIIWTTVAVRRHQRRVARILPAIYSLAFTDWLVVPAGRYAASLSSLDSPNVPMSNVNLKGPATSAA